MIELKTVRKLDKYKELISEIGDLDGYLDSNQANKIYDLLDDLIVEVIGKVLDETSFYLEGIEIELRDYRASIKDYNARGNNDD